MFHNASNEHIYTHTRIYFNEIVKIGIKINGS